MSGIFDAFTGGDDDGNALGATKPGRKSFLAVGGSDLASTGAGEILPEERGRVGSIQRQLAQETLFRARGYGLRSLLGPLGGGARTTLLGGG